MKVLGERRGGGQKGVHGMNGKRKKTTGQGRGCSGKRPFCMIGGRSVWLPVGRTADRRQEKAVARLDGRWPTSGVGRLACGQRSGEAEA